MISSAYLVHPVKTVSYSDYSVRIQFTPLAIFGVCCRRIGLRRLGFSVKTVEVLKCKEQSNRSHQSVEERSIWLECFRCE